MLTCIARSKLPGDDSLSQPDDSPAGPPNNKQQNPQAVKSLTSQLKDMALKASGAYRHCTPCAAPGEEAESEPVRRSSALWRTASANSGAGPRTGWGKELEARLKGISISGGDGSTPSSSVQGSRRRADPPVVFVAESEPKEWVAQVEPGVLITFVSLPLGGNDLKRIRFSRDMFNKWQAQRWWAENYDKVMELYNVQRLSRQAFPLPTHPISEDENSKMESIQNSPVTTLNRECLPRSLHWPTGMVIGYSSSDFLDHHPLQSRHYSDSTGLTSTPKLSSISGGTKTETSSMDSSSRDADRSEDLSISNASDLESVWVEQDEPGVYLTIRALPNGKRELRRVRFSRERFREMHARLWWEENRARIHEQYL